MSTFASQHAIPFFLLLVLIVQPVVAQETTTYVVHSDSKLWVEGTSNKNDWTVHANELSGEFVMQGSNVERVQITVPAAEIASNRSTIMDRLMHSALDASSHPTITFVLDDAETTGSDPFTVDASGKLTLAGETRDVALRAEGERLDDGRIRFTGTHPLTMSDYGIQPPTAMFGSLRTGDDATVHFEIIASPDTDTASN